MGHHLFVVAVFVAFLGTDGYQYHSYDKNDLEACNADMPSPSEDGRDMRPKTARSESSSQHHDGRLLLDYLRVVHTFGL